MIRLNSNAGAAGTGIGQVKVNTNSSGVVLECSESEWIAANRNYYQWYYNNYPQLVPSGITLPVGFEALKLFYIRDMQSRNLEPQQQWLNCYAALWSYLLGRLDDTINFEGQNWWQRTLVNLPGAINKTFDDISNTVTNPFGIPWWFWIGGLGVLLLLKK